MRMATGRTWRDGWGGARGDGRRGARMKGRERARVRGLNRIPTTGHRLGSRVVWGRLLPIIVTILTSFTTALVYGLGGGLAINGTLQLGTLVAMVALLMRLYGPVNQLSNLQSSAMVALVSFDRVFEVLDLKPHMVPAHCARDAFCMRRRVAPMSEVERKINNKLLAQVRLVE